MLGFRCLLGPPTHAPYLEAAQEGAFWAPAQTFRLNTKNGQYPNLYGPIVWGAAILLTPELFYQPPSN